MFALVRRLVAVVALLLALPSAAQEASPVQTAWRLLDYIAVDYTEAVRGGRVVNEAEYAEMTEFAGTARDLLAGLPASDARARLIADADRLKQLIAAKAAPEKVAASARGLARELLAAHPLPLAPASPPDPARGAQLYASQCASCHGLSGDGHGPAAAGLDPPPIAFTDFDRARQRSVFALYQVIEQGIDGTSMPSFAALPAQDRWALAFHVGQLAFPADTARAGEKEWSTNAAAREALPNLEALTQVTPAALAERLGQANADAITAYLRNQPDAILPKAETSLALARTRLAESVAAYEAGNRRRATDLALSAYLDGFEPVEPVLAARNGSLMAQIEGAMGELRARISRGAPPAEVRAQAEMVTTLFAEAETEIAPEQASPTSSFVGAFTVLLREGLEALLIVIAIVAFLRKSNRTDVLPYVHGGWVAALAAGVGTWWAATRLVDISGASRELTEGFGALFAAAVLLWVGIWMHGKSNAQAWQAYIRDKLDRALSKRSAWFLFGLAFLIVYREVFETILFYAALWSQGGGAALLAGAGAGAALLAVIAWAMLRYSRKLPITQFFAWSSALIAVLAVVLAGKGVSAIQEAGLLNVAPLPFVPRIEILGLYPTVQGVLLQIATLVALLIGFWLNNRRAPRDPARPAASGA